MKVESVCDRVHARAVGNHWLRLFTALVRVLLALGFIPSGLPKLLGHSFVGSMSPTTPVGHFFDGFFQAEAYYRFVGAAQMLAGCLLLFPRTAAIGAALYFPIILNIFVITLSVGFGGLTPVIAGLMLLANLYLLCWDYDRWKGLLPGFGTNAGDASQRDPGGLVVLSLAAAAVSGMLALFSLHQAWFMRRGGFGKPLLAFLASMALALGAVWLHRRKHPRFRRAA